MKYAIIAAGKGSRLAKEGIQTPKPLLMLQGERLIDRLLRIFQNNGATEILVICNEEMTEVAQHLADLQKNGLGGKPLPLRYKVKSTESSMHSLYALSPWLADEPFILTTVDTIFNEEMFAAYAQAFEQQTDTDAFMGVTTYIDDEKPLYVGMTEAGRITGFYDDNSHDCNHISAGIYGLTPAALTTLAHCIERGEKRMRNFQRSLIVEGQNVRGFVFTKVFDIDHASDAQKADVFLSENK